MGKYVLKEGKSGFRFNLKAANGEIIANSESYSSEKSALGGIESVKNNAPIAPIEDQTKEGYEVEKHPKFELYKDKKGEFRFRLKAKNGEIIVTGEGYVSKSGCKNGIESIKKNADSPIIREESAE